ncbi:Proteins of 100 residues with WXG [Actinacidiphila yanglinensis]|uniref:Proteins of 100 residues with WXG n=1 Tax=Actinacidiphila yanglinensis TaxID=310779 RepID=A0A1H5Y4U9_9ACTN|nr:WXG100 family type VII secretion target [Actinacidiphila yanglinensis]SEG18727.1 Proteins of 100 residues with WXG [Actinacidiphila yanglinensis]
MPDIESSTIRVGTELEGAGGYLNGQADQIMGELHALKRRIQSLIDTWNAQSASDYQERVHEWDMAAIGLFGSAGEGGVLGEIAAAMKVNWGNYVGAEEANIKTWSAAH